MPTLAQLITNIVLIVAVSAPLTILDEYALDFWHARYLVYWTLRRSNA